MKCSVSVTSDINDGRADIAVIVSEVTLGMSYKFAVISLNYTSRVAVGVEAYFGAG